MPLTANLEIETALPRPATAHSKADRRGPLRPGRLIPVRERLSGRVVARLFQLGDVLGVVLAAVAAQRLTIAEEAWGLILAAPAATIASLGWLDLYRFGPGETLTRHMVRLAIAFLLGSGLAALALWPLVAPAILMAVLGAWTCLGWATLTTLHLVWWLSVRRWRASGRLIPNIVVVGATDGAERLIAGALAGRDINVLGVFDDRLGRAPGSVGGAPVLGDTKALIGHRIMPYVDRIVIAVPSRAQARVRQLIERLRVLPNEIALVLDGQDGAAEAEAFSRAADVPLAHISGLPTNEVRATIKRAQDLTIGVGALIFAAPLMLILGVAVRLDSPGPILFRQRRHGFNNEEIVVWKFRSMRVEATDATASRQVVVDDERVTRLGRLMRRTSLDELPQIFNVLRGEMSLVGPRPHAVGMKTGAVESARLVAEYAHRHRMKPGVTGWAAIKGSRGPVDTPAAVRHRVALDIEYIERQSFWLDLYILAMTVPCLIGDRETVR